MLLSHVNLIDEILRLYEERNRSTFKEG